MTAPQIRQYLRVSTDDQQNSGLGMAAQRKTMAHYVQLMLSRPHFNGVEMGKEYAEPAAVSASVKFFHRVRGKELADEVCHGDHVVFSRLDRCFRNVADLVSVREEWQRKNITMHFCDLSIDMSTPTGELILCIMVSVAQWEARIIGDRTREALAAKKAAGEASGSGWKRGYLVGHVIKTERSLDGKRLVRYWYPNRRELPLLRYVVWMRDSCVHRRFRRTLKRLTKPRSHLQVVTRAESCLLGHDPEWTNWQQVSYAVIAARLQGKLQEKPEKLVFKSLVLHGRWDAEKCRRAYKEWFKTFAAHWPPRITLKDGKRIQG